jgi:nucleoside-diphosphate-sugar epimerase
VTVFGKGDERGGCAQIISALKRGFFPLLDGGGARRSLLHAENLADRVELLIDKGWKGGATWGVSDFNVSLRDFAALVKEHRTFALTPTVPLALAERLRVLDRYLSPVLPAENPVADAIARMSSDFVIHTRLFEHDYGYAPRLSLREAVAVTLS